MKYLLVWSLTVNSSLITGSATFPNKELCLEAQSVITDNKVVKNGAYIGCFEVQPNKDAPQNREMLESLHRKVDYGASRSRKNDKSLNEP